MPKSAKNNAAVHAPIPGLEPDRAAAGAPSRHESAAWFVERWMDLWNGKLDLADDLIADEFRLHATMLDGRDSEAIDTPAAFANWVVASRTACPDLVFTPVVGPMLGSVDGRDLSLAVHWQASGPYAGGIPFATVAPGTPIRFSGTDVVRVSGGKVSDYWLVTDTLAMFAALGIGAATAQN